MFAHAYSIYVLTRCSIDVVWYGMVKRKSEGGEAQSFEAHDILEGIVSVCQ